MQGAFTVGMCWHMTPADTPLCFCVLQLLYDLIFEKADPTSPACSSTHRDTKNRTMLSHERNLGGQLTTNK